MKLWTDINHSIILSSFQNLIVYLTLFIFSALSFPLPEYCRIYRVRYDERSWRRETAPFHPSKALRNCWRSSRYRKDSFCPFYSFYPFCSFYLFRIFTLFRAPDTLRFFYSLCTDLLRPPFCCDRSSWIIPVSLVVWTHNCSFSTSYSIVQSQRLKYKLCYHHALQSYRRPKYIDKVALCF